MKKEYRFKLTSTDGNIILQTIAENLQDAVKQIHRQLEFNENDIRQILCRPVKYPKFS
jgi:hypothetical protein